MAEKTFMLGVGCQKGGTSWLHDHLGFCPGVRMGYTKEYHLLNRRAVARCEGDPRRAASHHGRAGFLLGRALGAQALMRHYIKHDIRNYFDHFADILHSAPEVTLTGENTPAYAGLPTAALAMVREGFAERGVRVKVLFLLRDPVERVLSATRMYRRNRQAESGDAAISEPEQDEVLRYSQTPQCRYLTAYHDTMQRLETVFPPEDVHYEFYERLFRPESIEAITGFLGIAGAAPDFSRMINVSRNDNELSAAARLAIFEQYRDTYGYIAERFGEPLMRELWPNYRAFGG